MAALLLGTVVLGGCVGGVDVLSDDCELQTRVLNESIYDDLNESIPDDDRYSYSAMSPAGKTVVRRAIRQGAYETTNESLDPPEFTYTDEFHDYAVTYRNQTYLLETSSPGC